MKTVASEKLANWIHVVPVWTHFDIFKIKISRVYAGDLLGVAFHCTVA
jgi:hypothetical protein